MLPRIYSSSIKVEYFGNFWFIVPPELEVSSFSICLYFCLFTFLFVTYILNYFGTVVSLKVDKVGKWIQRMGKWSLTHPSVGEGTLKTVLWTVLLKVRKFVRVSLKDVDVEIEDFDDVRVRYSCDLEMAVLSLMKSILELSLLIISILVLITLETSLLDFETIFIFSWTHFRIQKF